jgi:hypothetical protein
MSGARREGSASLGEPVALNRSLVDLMFETMNPSPDGFELGMIVGRDGLVALLLQLPDLRFDGGFIDASGFVVRVHVDAESFAERHEQVVFVQLGVALQRLMLNASGDLAQLRHGLPFEFLICVGHFYAHPFVVCGKMRSIYGDLFSINHRR